MHCLGNSLICKMRGDGPLWFGLAKTNMRTLFSELRNIFLSAQDLGAVSLHNTGTKNAKLVLKKSQETDACKLIKIIRVIFRVFKYNY